MAPNKFEKHIKKQLEEREIEPSVNAWERLSEKLETASPQSKKRNYFWYGIAASFIGLLIISLVYLNSEGSLSTPDIEIVESSDGKIETETETNSIKEENDIEEEVVGNNAITQLPTNDVKTTDKNRTVELKNQITAIEEMDNVIDKVAKKRISSKAFKEEIINTKILEIVAAVDSLEQNNTTLTEAEVDDLLRNAQEEIFRDKLFNQNGSVDAMALLTEVEDELDKSFRDEIFENLKSGFLKLRTAVADRNK